MIRYTKGNLLEADVEAVVNTVNTVGVMGKGIALMFREAFPVNYEEYREACRDGEVKIGQMLVTHRGELLGPKWIINFPTKKDWRGCSRIEWIRAGLVDLHRVIAERGIRSIAIPPLGCGNGKLSWRDIRSEIEEALHDLTDVEIIAYEPTPAYRNVMKRRGVEKLTPARALIVEIVRRYGILGMSCSILETQKLAWFLERVIHKFGPDNPLDLKFTANKYGPYSDRLRHLLDSLDGSYLHCERRLADAHPMDTISFDHSKKNHINAYLKGPEGEPYESALEETSRLIEGFETPYGLELLATVDWLLEHDCEPSLKSIKKGLDSWPGGSGSAARKMSLFDDRVLQIALDRLVSTGT